MQWFKHQLRSTASKILAALVGGLICTIALTIGITLVWPFGRLAVWPFGRLAVWPFGDTVEQIFAGGTFFFVFWAALFYWAILAPMGTQAWKRILGLLIPVTAIDIVMLSGLLS